MELSYLDFELRSIKEKDEKKEIEIIMNGEVIYDPNEHCLIFNSEKNSFQIHSSEIKIKEEYLTKERIVFDYEKENKKYEVHIFSSKFDTLCKKTIQILNMKFIKEEKKRLRQIYSDKNYKDIIKEPKDYQKEMLEEAKKKNIIVFLETGMGKTYISILLIKDIYGEPLNSNRNNIIQYEKKTNKKVLCLFKTVSLLLQQSKVIKHNK